MIHIFLILSAFFFNGYVSCTTKYSFWFRVYGYGLSFKDTRAHGLLFSERNGNRKYLRLGHWVVRVLKPGRSARSMDIMDLFDRLKSAAPTNLSTALREKEPDSWRTSPVFDIITMMRYGAPLSGLAAASMDALKIREDQQARLKAQRAAALEGLEDDSVKDALLRGRWVDANPEPRVNAEMLNRLYQQFPMKQPRPYGHSMLDGPVFYPFPDISESAGKDVEHGCYLVKVVARINSNMELPIKPFFIVLYWGVQPFSKPGIAPAWWQMEEGYKDVLLRKFEHTAGIVSVYKLPE